MSEQRRQQIQTAIAAELNRQAAKADAAALAAAVEAALTSAEVGSTDEGKTPDELNAANDE